MPSSYNKPVDANWYPPWAPRFWHGMRTSNYFRLLRENRFQIHPTRVPMAVLVGMCSLANSSLGAFQSVLYRKKIEATELKPPPIFIIGHWRSGTTMMHELISLDDRFAFPSNFDAFVPEHFLVSRSFFYPLIRLLLPSRRPMDNMSLSIASPQEDDFALVALGAPTPYRRIAFPNRPSRDHLQLNLEGVDAESQQQVRSSLTYFLKALTYHYQKPLVLKSPPHTGRLAQLAQWFPHAKFVHMAREPESLVSSTMRLWKLLDEIQGFQLPRYDDTWLRNYIAECKDLMYSAYLQQRSSLPANRLAEVRFEDLVANPVAEVGRVYKQLELENFSNVQPHIEQYFAQRKGHQKNKLALPDDTLPQIQSDWREYRQAFGY